MKKSVLQGKKLLILGASPNEISLVERAKHYGIYTIVTDKNLDHALSPSKDFADEYWDISWADIDALESKCKETGIDGVISGYSEFRVENNIKLCERLGLPCYVTMEQLDITRDKIKFKDQCRKSGVPVIKEYASVEDVDSYPVIVKPTDRAGSIGISVAADKEELEKAFNYAMEMSVCKKVIIEKYIGNAKKFDAYYSIINGEIDLISTDDVIKAEKNGLEKVVQSGWVLPSVKDEAFKNSENDYSLRKMISDMGIQNGYIFFSGFAFDDGSFAFFECGFRLCGGYFFNYFPLIGKVNNMDLFLFHSLLGNCEQAKYDVIDGDPLIKCVTVNLYAKKGTISKIGGFDELKNLETCKFCVKNARLGQVCSDENAILSKIGMAYFCEKDVNKIADDVAKMYDIITCLDENGEDMIYDYIDIDTIRNWWK